jgi:hypothetical protein
MKRTLLMMIVVFCLCYSLQAGPCGVTTLATYDAPGFSCTIGNLTFSDFSYSPSGSVLIPDTSVSVKPETIGGESGFRFNAPWFALPNTILDSFINFTVTCNGCSLNDWLMSIGGVSLPATDAFVNVGETSPDVAKGLKVGSFGGTSTLTDSATFAPVGSVTVSKDLIVFGGSTTNGGIIAQVSSLTNLFSTTTTSMVPEPGLLVLCTGLLALVPVARRMRRKVSS